MFIYCKYESNITDRNLVLQANHTINITLPKGRNYFSLYFVEYLPHQKSFKLTLQIIMKCIFYVMHPYFLFDELFQENCWRWIWAFYNI